LKQSNIALNDDKVYKRDKLPKIPKDTIKIIDKSQTVKPNVIKQATKKKKREIFHKKERIEEENAILHKRRNETTK
jgi:hypothetical protein